MAGLIWGVIFGLMLLAVCRKNVMALSKKTESSIFSIFLKATIALLLIGVATYPAAIGVDTADRLMEFVGTIVLFMQVSPLLLHSLQLKKHSNLVISTIPIYKNESFYCFFAIILIFAYVRFFGDPGTFLGLIDASILLGPLMVWIALRGSALSVIHALLWTPLASAYFQHFELGGTPKISLIFGTSGITTLTLILTTITCTIYWWRCWVLHGANGFGQFGVRVTILSCGSLLALSLAMGVITIQQSRWQSIFILERFTQETVRIIENSKNALTDLLIAPQNQCSATDRSNLKRMVENTAFILELGLLDGAGVVICSSKDAPNMLDAKTIPEGFSYISGPSADSAFAPILIAIKNPGGRTAYAVLDMTSLHWFFHGFSYGRSDSISLKLDGRKIFNAGVSKNENQLAYFEKNIFEPRYLIETKITSGREAIIAGFMPLAGIILTGCAIALIFAILTSNLRVMEQQAKHKAEAESKIRAEFLAVMSHEIRTPLNGLLGNLEILQTDKSQNISTPSYRSILNDAYTSSKILLAIINDVLDISKIEAEGLILNANPTNLREIIEQTRQIYSTNAKTKGLDFDSSINIEKIHFVQADSLRLQQILGNLLSNAIKFTDRGSIKLVVSSSERDQFGAVVDFSVIDTGIGISEKYIPRLFDPFYQTPSGARATGTGLGLAICNKLIKLMGGSLNVDSTVGVGSTFRFSLYFEHSPPSINATDERIEMESKKINQLAHMKGSNPVLIVDDHPLGLELLSRQLSLIGFSTIQAGNMADAMNLFESEKKISAIITDENMLGGNGTEFAKKIRDIETVTANHIPIILCTADITLHATDLIKKGIIDAYLSKPYDLDKLKKLIWEHVDFSDINSAFPSKSDGRQIKNEKKYASQIIELTSLLKMVGGNHEKAANILDQLYSSTQNDLENFERLIDCKNLDGAAKIAHRIKGPLQMVGVSNISKLAESLEKSTQLCEIGKIRVNLTALREESRRLQYFSDHLRNSPESKK